MYRVPAPLVIFVGPQRLSIALELPRFKERIRLPELLANDPVAEGMVTFTARVSLNVPLW